MHLIDIIISSIFISADTTSIVSDSILEISGNQIVDVNPWTLMIVGMITVFFGLLIINITINLLKIFTQDKKKHSDEDEKEINITKQLLKKVNLTQDEILAVSMGIAIEYELYYSDAEQILTFNYPEREPSWLSTRR